MDILRKSMAPICDKAWDQINSTAVEVFTSVLSARKFVDVDGPKGLNFSAVSLGRLHVPENQKEEVQYGMHQVLPLVETRVPFELNIWELDNMARGAKSIDLNNLEEAARKLARFEENAIYNGFNPSGIKGLSQAADFDPIALPENDEAFIKTISEAVAKFKNASIQGPYSLVLNMALWERFNASGKGYPLRKRVEVLLGGAVIAAPFIDGAFMVSERGGDFELTIGQDISIGYESHNSKTVQLYFTESFTFRVIDPAAVIPFKE
ncbi:family 1 encapsulin nanocompartment shell protein [Thermophagus sp. OGC60D27]|uniref:family 1 encapsulin nanocompartment shell protein n=1 Tax=Thermophagus sp. OGC60D27 TaxID=3458415 RepID=UPI0040382A4A